MTADKQLYLQHTHMQNIYPYMYNSSLIHLEEYQQTTSINQIN